MSAVPLLEARNIRRRFGHVHALDGVNFSVYPGEICALIGDNGAGKSTLVKILSGADRPDEGRILLEGREVSIASPLAAQELGIATVYQDLALAPDLAASDNLFLGREIMLPGALGRLGFLNRREMRSVSCKRAACSTLFVRSGIRESQWC
jgi:simple sugar transport system ATP-binding protein